jgi:hypothetical protein
MKIGYARVSKGDRSLDRHIDALIEQGVKPCNIYQEAESSVKRPDGVMFRYSPATIQRWICLYKEGGPIGCKKGRAWVRSRTGR